MSDMVVYQAQESRMLMPSIPLNDIKRAYQDKKEFINSILRDGVDYGAVPGTEKKTLLKPGAEKMTAFFSLSPDFVDIEKVEDWTGENHNGEPFFYYRIKCTLFNGDWKVASADGSCNSWEKKYRYRNGNRKCPDCGAEAIFKSKDASGFYCWNKKGGCGAKFAANDQRIIKQELGQVINPDIADSVNTILKMAQKRALIAATLIATGTSEYFTQDMEDFIDEPIQQPAQPKQAEKKSQPVEPKPASEPLDFFGLQVPDISLETAMLEKNSQGILYSELPKEKLQHMARKMADILHTGKVGDAEINDEQRAEYMFKLSCIKAIVNAL